MGKQNFLSRVDWKPVHDLKVANNGHSLQVTNDMLLGAVAETLCGQLMAFYRKNRVRTGLAAGLWA